MRVEARGLSYRDVSPHIDISVIDTGVEGEDFADRGINWSPQYAELCAKIGRDRMVVFRARDRLSDSTCDFLIRVGEHVPLFWYRAATPKALWLRSAQMADCHASQPPTAVMLKAVIARIRQTFPDLDVIHDPGSSADVTALLRSALGEKAGVLERQLDAFHRFDVPPSFDDYMASFPKKRRYNLKRQSRLLDERFGGLIAMTVVEGADQKALLDAAFSKFTPAASRADADRYASACIETGLMKSFVLHAGDRCIALAVGSGAGRNISIHSTHYDPELAALSPGTELWYRIVRHASENGYRQISMGFGDPGRATASSNVIETRSSVIYPLFRWSNACKLLAVTRLLGLRNWLRLRKQRDTEPAPEIAEAF